MAEFKVASAYAEFRVDVDKGIDEAVARIRARSHDLDTAATVQVDADTALAKRKIRELGDAREKATVQADADTALAKAKLKALGDDKIASPKIKPEVDKGAADRATSELGRIADRANAQFDALKFTALSVGLPAAAAVGAAGVGVSLAAIGAGFIGLQAVYAKNEENFSRSWANLQTVASSSVEQMSKGIGTDLAQASDSATASFVRMRPAIDLAFRNSRNQIQPLTDGVTGLAENAMPGLLVATQNLYGPVNGLKSLFQQTGSGMTDFFVNASTGAESAGQNLSTLGGIARDALGFLGQLFANVSNNGIGSMQQLQAMLREVEGALTALTSSGSGALGFLQGFGSAATGMLAVINLVSHGLALLPPEVAQLGGSVAASGMLLSQFGVNVGKGFEGLGDKIKAAEGAGGKMKAAFSGLVEGAFSPAALAAVGLGAALDVLGEHQRKAAAAAQAQQERVQSLAEALRKSNGAIDDNVRATAAQELQNTKVGDSQLNMLEVARQLHLSQSDLTSAYLGSEPALARLNAAQQNAIPALQEQTKAQGLNYSQTEKLGDAYKAFYATLNGGDFAKAAQSNRDLANATANSVKPTTELSSAMDTLRNGAAQTADRVSALRTELDILSGRTPVFEDGIKAGNDALRNMADSLKNGVDKADGFGNALVNVDGTVNTVTKNGSALQSLAEGLQGSFVNAASGLDQMVRRGVPFDQATKQINDSLQTQRDRFVDVAQKMGLSQAEAQKLADKYGLIPKTITTEVGANVKQAQAAIDALPPYMAGTQGAVIVSAVVDPATGKINETVQYADGSTGHIVLDGIRDPVTGKTLAAIQYADGSKGTITIDGFNQLAKDGAVSAVRFADGRVGTVTIKANTDQARGSVQAFLDSYLGSVIRIPVVAAPQKGAPPLPFPHTGGLVGSRFPGGLKKFASGGLAGGGGFPTLNAPRDGALDLTSGGRISGPGTGTSDSILAMVSNTEAVINARETARNLSELAAINSGQRDYSKYPETGRPPSAGGGSSSVVAPTVNVTINVTQRDNQDSYAFAQMVARELEQRMRVA